MKEAASARLDLEGHTGTYRVQWFDPRAGGPLQNGSVSTVTGPGLVSIGSPPGSEDWVALVRTEANRAPVIESVTADPDPFPGRKDFALQVRVTDPDGQADVASVCVHFGTPDLLYAGIAMAEHAGGNLYTVYVPNLDPLQSGQWWTLAVARDAAGAKATDWEPFQVP